MLKKTFAMLAARWGRPRPGFRDAFDLFRSGGIEEAERICDSLIERGESFADAWYLKGLLFRHAGQNTKAIAAMRIAVEEAPGEPAYVLMLGEWILSEQGYAAALPYFAKGCRLAEGQPMHADALADLGSALAGVFQDEEAHQAFRQALALDPAHSAALVGEADLLYNESEPEAAQEVASKRITSSRDTSARLRRALLLPIIAGSVDEITVARQRFGHELDLLLADKTDAMPNPESSVGMTAFYLAYHGLDDRPLMDKLAAVVRKNYAGATTVPDFRGRFRRRKRRVAFVSTNFNTHSIGRTTIGWIGDLPRSEFDVWVFSIAPHPGDAFAEEIRRAADTYVVLSTDMASIRAAIEAGEPDFLIFADLGMHPLTYYLAFWRMAPVQLVAWGHPVSMGIDTVDHFISSEMLEAPGSEQQYSENLLRLSRYFMPRYARPHPAPGSYDRSTFGLPRQGNLYGCLQTMFKLHPDFDDIFANILERDPAAHIVLVEARKPWTRKVLARLAPRLGPHIGRVVVLPQRPTPEFLKMVSCMNVLLDPLYFGGNNSSAEGLSLGVPVITLPAQQLRGRFTLGHYVEMDFHDCIVDTPEAFTEQALFLGTNPDARKATSERILRRCGRLFDRPDAGLSLGEALQRLAPS
jgi:predicted O-linked N-acetylglucosamine transferase (SPINDLY family)